MLEKKVEKIVESTMFWFVARCLLALVFISGALAKLIDFDAGVAEMRAVGLEPAVFYNLAVSSTLIIGSVLLFMGRFVWLGAGVLGCFLVLTIVVVHRFWALPETEAMLALYFALEHLSLIGGLMAAAIAGHFHNVLRRW